VCALIIQHTVEYQVATHRREGAHLGTSRDAETTAGPWMDAGGRLPRWTRKPEPNEPGPRAAC
jgi:hypothetical protein